MCLTALPLTYNEGGDEAGGRDGRVALWPEGLQQVVGEGERGDGVAGRDDDEQRGPQVQERRQRAEGLVDVRVVPAGLGNHNMAWHTVFYRVTRQFDY